MQLRYQNSIKREKYVDYIRFTIHELHLKRDIFLWTFCEWKTLKHWKNMETLKFLSLKLFQEAFQTF